jgi:hypothetical protein
MYEGLKRGIDMNKYEEVVLAMKSFPNAGMPRGRSVYYALKERLRLPSIGYFQMLQVTRVSGEFVAYSECFGANRKFYSLVRSFDYLMLYNGLMAGGDVGNNKN